MSQFPSRDGQPDGDNQAQGCSNREMGYARSFTQETRVNDADFGPLIAFIRCVNQSDDETFVRELPDRLDVDAFATYLALNNLLVNTDSMIGMNNNYYWYYDESATRFTLLMWGANESLPTLGGNASYDLYFANTQTMGGGHGPGNMGGENVLMERFLAVPAFKSLYEQNLRDVYEKVFLSGAFEQSTLRYAGLIDSVNDSRQLVDMTAYEQAIQRVLTFIEKRTAYLVSTELLGR
ncbi:MAG: CotH kinase family protein [Anaerolineales bacterium]